MSESLATPDDRATASPARPAIDAVHVRSYDHAEGHSVRVTVADPDGEVRLTERCYLAPGQSRVMGAELAPGRYRLSVRVDGVDRDRSACRLGPDAALTALVELGNGVVSVSQGPDRLAPA